MQRGADQPDGSTDDVPVERDALGRGWRGGNLPSGEEAQNGEADCARGGDLRRCSEQARQDCAPEDGDIGACLNQPSTTEHFVLLRCCGRIAYLIGPKKVEWTPIMQTAASISGMLASMMPAPPRTMMPISASFTILMIFDLS